MFFGIWEILKLPGAERGGQAVPQAGVCVGWQDLDVCGGAVCGTRQENSH